MLNLFYTPVGIRHKLAVWYVAAPQVASTCGAMNGRVKMVTQKRWRNASVYHLVRGLLGRWILLTISQVDFKARDIQWSPDGKGMVLLDKDAFCCAIEVDDSPT
jgi:hypothetical protein